MRNLMTGGTPSVASHLSHQNNMGRDEARPSQHQDSPALLRQFARAYSQFNFAIKLALISAGHTASHSYVFVQLPKPSASMARTIFRTRVVRSGEP